MGIGAEGYGREERSGQQDVRNLEHKGTRKSLMTNFHCEAGELLSSGRSVVQYKAGTVLRYNLPLFLPNPIKLPCL